MAKTQAGFEVLNKALQVGMNGQYLNLTLVRMSPSQNAGPCTKMNIYIIFITPFKNMALV